MRGGQLLAASLVPTPYLTRGMIMTNVDTKPSNYSTFPSWPENNHEIPTWIYSNEQLFDREMEVFFGGNTWNYVGLECEVPEPNSFKRSWIGTTQVVVTRDAGNQIHVVENRCTHRGTPVCWKQRGDASSLVCPYHQWTFGLDGKLLGLPFIRGAFGKGGMPKDFDKSSHGLRAAKVVVRGGGIWASFGESPPPLEDYFGPEILSLYDRFLNGRPLKLLGSSRQILPNNWKLYHENLRDLYHAAILHTFLVTYGLYRADVEHLNDTPENGRHEYGKSIFSKKTRDQVNEAVHEMTLRREGQILNEMSMVEPEIEFDDGLTSNFNVFPSVHIQQHGNIFSMRHIIPKDVRSMELAWTQFGYADDSSELEMARLKQANLVGPAGYISAEDGEVLALIQTNVERHPDVLQPLEMGGRDINLPSDNMLNEDLLRSFYRFYRREMGL